MPVLQPDQRKKYGLVTQTDHLSSAPYWRHDTMSCHEVPHLLRWLNQKLIEERVALEGSLFYAGLMGYRQSDREDLLDFQRDVLHSLGPLRWGFSIAQQALKGALRLDIKRKLSPLPPASEIDLSIGSGHPVPSQPE